MVFKHSKVYLSSLALIFGTAAFSSSVHAESRAVVITEIAASLPSDEEWIEIYNAADTEVDISAWRFVEGFTESDPDGVRHKLNPYRGDARLASREYAIIANNAAVFLERHRDFSGSLFDSAWSSLKESGERVSLIDENGNVVEEFSYIENTEGVLARKDPLRANYSAENWAVVQGEGTPGKPYDAATLMPGAEIPPVGSVPPVSSQEPSSSPSSPEISPLEPPIADAGSDVAARVGEAIIFDGSRSYDASGGALSYNWDFGDGAKADGAIAEHSFALEGDYRARLTVSNSAGDDSDDVRVTAIGETDEPASFVKNESQTLTPDDAVIIPSRAEAIMEGIITVEPGIFARTYFYIASKDGQSGLQVYSQDGSFPDLHIGQLVEVTGRTSSYYGVKRIIIDSPEAISVIRGADPPIPEKFAPALVPDLHLGRLIVVEGEIVKEEGKIFIAQDGARVRIEIKPETGISKTDLKEGDTVLVTGIIDKTVSGLRLLPRYPGDIALVAAKDEVARNDNDVPDSVANEPRVLGEKAEISLPEVEYTPSENALEYTTEAQSQSGIMKYLVASAIALALILAGIFFRERHK